MNDSMFWCLTLVACLTLWLALSPLLGGWRHE